MILFLYSLPTWRCQLNAILVRWACFLFLFLIRSYHKKKLMGVVWKRFWNIRSCNVWNIPNYFSSCLSLLYRYADCIQPRKWVLCWFGWPKLHFIALCNGFLLTCKNTAGKDFKSSNTLIFSAKLSALFSWRPGTWLWNKKTFRQHSLTSLVEPWYKSVNLTQSLLKNT